MTRWVTALAGRLCDASRRLTQTAVASGPSLQLRWSLLVARCWVARRCWGGGAVVRAALGGGRVSREAVRCARLVDGRQLPRGSLTRHVCAAAIFRQDAVSRMHGPQLCRLLGLFGQLPMSACSKGFAERSACCYAHKKAFPNVQNLLRDHHWGRSDQFATYLHPIFLFFSLSICNKWVKFC